MQNSFLTSDDVAKGPHGTNVPMAIKFSPDGMPNNVFNNVEWL